MPVAPRRPLAAGLLALAVLLAPVVAGAQDAAATISGRVVARGSGEPLVNARVEAIRMPARRSAAVVTTNADGRYTLTRLAPGAYSLVVTRLGYALRRVDAVLVEPGGAARVDVEMTAVPTQLEQVVTSASRAPEKVLDAPASISVVSERAIRERPSLTAVDHLRAVPGVDASQGGLTQSNVVARGFNNAFSGALLMLQDNRFASVPSLRVNIPGLFTSTNEDIDRIEVVLGPGAALYGPNAASGVMHIITKSPFDSKGTTLTLDGGERSVMRLAGRHANALGERVAFKLSGEYMSGREWEYRDPAEPPTFPATPNTPAARVGKANARDFDVQRYAGEARLDWRPAANTEVITSYGYAHIGNGIELTGANGTAQIRDWTYQHLQTRFRRGRLFAQAFANFSDAGNDDANDLDGTFLLRTGQSIVDQSRTAAFQLQHGVDWGRRQTFLYGSDLVFTNPRTGGTINGRNEDDDDMRELGGYVHSITRLSPKWDLVSAFRVDVNDRLDGRFYSPRAAIVWKPTELQNVRVSYNRAFSTPTNFNLFLDLAQGSLRGAGLPVDIIALGVPEDGYRFRRDCAGGVGDLCMRSNLPPANDATRPTVGFVDAIGYQQALAAALAGGLRDTLVARLGPATANAVITRLVSLNPTRDDVGTLLRVLNPGAARGQEFATVVSPDYVQDVDALKAQFVNNFELGYKGVLGERFRISVDGWWQERRNFVTAAVNMSPSVFLDGAATAAYVRDQLTPTVGAANAAALAPGIATALARVPAGTVVPDNGLTDEGDIYFTYRNLDRAIQVYGSDVGMDFALTRRLALAGTYSWVSDDEFEDIPNGVAPLSLNAPAHKASLTTRWSDDDAGFSVEARGRYANAFPVNSGVFVGHVPVAMYLDAGFSWRLPLTDGRATWGVNVTNLLDNRRASFIGVPEIGRLALTRLQYHF